MKMRVLSLAGVVEVDLPDPDDRSTVGGHWSAVGYYTDRGNTNKLGDYEGVEVGDPPVRLETDPDAVDEWWSSGELDFLEVYVT